MVGVGWGVMDKVVLLSGYKYSKCSQEVSWPNNEMVVDSPLKIHDRPRPK